jgi:hypothetical protein
VELHTLAKRQGHRLAVGGDHPALGQPRQGLEVLIVAGQRVVEVLLEREVGEGKVVGIERVPVVRHADGEGATALLGGGAAGSGQHGSPGDGAGG